MLIAWNGTTWTRLADVSAQAGSSSFVGIHGTSPAAIRAFLQSGTLYAWNGTSFAQEFTVPYYQTWYDAHWTALDEMWAVGTNGSILHWDGSAADQQQTLTNATLTDVTVAADGHAFAVGWGGTILHRAPQ